MKIIHEMRFCKFLICWDPTSSNGMRISHNKLTRMIHQSQYNIGDDYNAVNAKGKKP